MEASKKVMKRTKEAKKTKTTSSKKPKEKMEKPKTQRNAASQGAIVEKNRRKKMKDLCASLGALLPPPPPPHPTAAQTQEKMEVLSTLDRSKDYVSFLKERVEQLRKKRDGLNEDLVMADVQVHENDSVLEVNVVTGLNKGYVLHKILKILEEEGARVLTANHSRLTDKIVYSVVSQAFSARIGIATSRVHERLKVLSGMSTLPPPAGLLGESSSTPI